MIGSLTSCDPADQFKTELSEIDSCLTKLDSLQQMYDGIEFDSLRMMVAHVEKNESLIKELYQPDTLNEEFGRQMNDSKTIRKSLKHIDKDELAFKEELAAVKNQFLNLKEDILNGIYSEEQVKEYLEGEKAALDKVNLAFSGFYKMQEGEKYRYYVVVPGVDEFIEELRANREDTE